MDPLSIAGSVAGLISLADTVFRKLFHYVNDVKNAEKNVQKLKNEVAALSGVLHNLHVVAEDLEADEVSQYSTRAEHVNSCLATLYKLDESLKKISLSDNGKRRDTIHKLSWPFKSANITQFIEDVRQHRNNLSLALSADSMTALLKCLSVQDKLLQRVNDIDIRLFEKESIMTRIAMDDKRQRILDHFLFVNPHENFRTSLKLRFPTTGFWLTESDIFSTWLRGSSSHLWLSGIPGAGKTVLSSLIIQECMNRSTTERAVAFFYCDYKTLNSQNAVNILGSIASQLARQNEDSFQILERYYIALHPEHQLAQHPETEQLIKLLQCMSSTFEDVRIIVDGLDECGSSTVEVVEAFKSVIYEHETISLALLSRDEVEIREQLGPPVCAYIEIAAHTKDIEHYVRSEIENRITKKKLRVKSIKLKDEIVFQLVTRAQGMFRWVSCQLDHLCELPTDAQRRKALTQLPKTLHETYERILQRVEEHTVPLVRRTLQWIIHAERKLTIEELVEIVSLEDDDDTLNSEAYPDPEELLRSCGSLVRKAHGCLELAHFTVQEFLAAINPDNERLNLFRVSASNRLTLAKACVSYLCLSTFDQPPMILFQRDKTDYPFLAYASEFFLVHTLPYQSDDGLSEQLHLLFHPEKTYNFALFMLERLKLHASFLHDHEMVSVCSPTFGPLHGAAMLHMHRICQWLVDQDCDINQVSPMGAPLECAIYGTAHVLDSAPVRTRHLGDQAAQATISVLLGAGAVCDIELVHGNSLSSAAAEYNPWDPTSPFALMLQHGMPLQADAIPVLLQLSNENQQRFFHSIDVLNGEISISPEVRIHLLNFAHTEKLITSVSIPSKDRMTDKTFLEAIRHAVRFNQVSAFEKLVANDRSSIDLACRGEGGTFHCAAKHHSVQILHTLLDLGCDPAITDELGKSVLHDIIRLGISDKRLLCRLISSEAVNVLDRECRSVWHEAASEGNVQVLGILFNQPGPHKSLIQQPCKNGITPILEAILRQHADCADLLLSGICADKAIVLDERALHNAVAMGMHSFLERLRDCGVDFCAMLERSQTALYYLTSFTKKHTMDLLLSCGLDACHLDTRGRPPLVAFLALNEPRDHRMLTLVKGPEKHVLEKSVIEALANTFSAAARDEDGHAAWFYFCTRMIPFILGSDMATKQSYLTDILSILFRYDACKVYEDATGASGVVILVKMCLDSVNTSKKPGKYSRKIHDTRTVIAALLGDLLSGISTAGTFLKFANDSQIIRLLVWSVAASQRPLIKRLLELGVDAHAVSDHYHGMTALDQSITLDNDPEILDLLLQRADTSQLLTVNEDGDFTYFSLCFPNPDMRTKNRITKLEILLKAGVNPDARAPSTRIMAHTAAENACLKALQLLVRFNADLSLADRYGWTIVQFAVADGNLDLLRFVHEHLIEDRYWTATFSFGGQISDFDDPDSGPLPVESYFGCNLLHLAVFFGGKAATLRFLKEIRCFEDVDAKTLEGATPLHFAACIASPSSTRWLIRNGANVNMPLGAKKRTALHYALHLGHLDNALALIEAGATFISDSDGISPEMGVHSKIRSQLLAALPHCRVSIPPFVLDNLGSDYKLQRLGGLHRTIMEGDYEACLSIAESRKPLTRSIMDCGTCTPLIVALAWGQLDIAKVFLQHGASTDGFPCAQARGMGPLFHSALNIAISQPIFNGILQELLRLTLKHEAHWSQGSEHWQPLHLAAAYNAGGVKVLLDHVNKHEDLIIVEACAKNHPGKKHELWNSYLECCTLPEATPKYPWLVPGGTALHVAAWNKNLTALDILLAHGADLNAKALDGRTPLHYAVDAGCVTSTVKLLQHGTAPRSLDMEHITPFALACITGNVEMVKLLVKYEHDKTAVDIYGSTALHHAARNSQLQTFIYLLDAGWDPYQLNHSCCSPIYYATSHARLATYVNARYLDISHLAMNREKRRELPLHSTSTATRCFFRRFPVPIRMEYLNTQPMGQLTPLMMEASHGRVERMGILLLAGADMEICDAVLGTALMISSHSNQFSSVKFLVRERAKMVCEINGRVITALQAADGYPDIIHWFLVDQYLDQGKLANDAFNSEHEPELRFWSGIRQVQIPLRGKYERPMKVSLEEHARHLHSIVVPKDGWRSLVPLGWDSVAHFTPLPVELGYRKDA